MKFALILAAVAVFAGRQDTPTTLFTEPFVGFQLSYPKTWKIVKSTKRKDKGWTTTFSIPVAGSGDKADFVVDRVEYHASTDLWQQIQKDENELLHREVVRQWTQEVLGVSMLFTQLSYVDHGTQTTAVSALYYTRTPEKLLLRVSSPSSDFDAVNFDFARVLETVRQLDGKMPQEDDPTIALATPSKKPTLASLNDPHLIEAVVPHKVVQTKGPVTVRLVVSTRNLIVHLPRDWAGDAIKDNTFDVQYHLLNHPLQVALFSLLDSEPGPTALLKLSAANLNGFSKVATREDTGPKTNKAGCSISATWRVGAGTSGDLATCEAMGTMSGYYFLLTYRQTDLSQLKADRKLIEELLGQISIESVQ